MIRKLLLIALSIFFFFTACTKISSTDIGTGLIPPIDGVNTFDSILTVETATAIDEDITRAYKTDEHVVGVINNDPLFGKTLASAYFELKPAFYKFHFLGKKEDLVVDSAVLILSYKGSHGDTSIPQTWRVYEIDKTQTNRLKYDSAYGTNNRISLAGQLGVRTNIDLRRFTDSVNYGFEKAKNQIRIKLDNSFANRLIKQYDSSNAYSNDSAFRSNFAGFAVVPDQGLGNALVRINLSDTNTKVALFYKYKSDTSTVPVSTVGYFRYVTGAGTQTSGNANLITRDRAGSEVLAHLPNLNDNLVYIQTSPGTYVKIKIPGLDRFPNSLIHRAELIAEQAPIGTMLDEQLAPPRYLFLSAVDPTIKGRRNIPNDYQVDYSSGLSNINSFGGFLTYKTNGTARIAAYSFNLTRYVQGVVTRKDTTYELRLSAPSNDSIKYKDVYPSAAPASTYYITPPYANIIANGRVRLHGGAATVPQRMRLRIIYSKL